MFKYVHYPTPFIGTRDTIIVCNPVKGMQCNICNLRMDICRKLATDSMNVVLCIGLLYSLLSTIGSRECREYLTNMLAC